MIEKYKAKRLEKVAPATVNRELACLKHMYTKAIVWDFVKTNPVKRVKSLKEPPGRLRYLKQAEFEALFETCADYIKPILITALNTGMRKGEILKLKWADVDLKNRKITVIETKNNESRIVPINNTLYQELLSLFEKAKSEFVFTDSNGLPFGDIKKSFSAAVKRAGLENFRFHDLRHTFGSYLVMQGADLKTVQRIMGHKDIRMTLRYAHLSPRYVQEAVESLDKLWTLYGHQEKADEKEKRVNH